MMEFTKDQLYWIERCADIESSIIMEKFTKLVQTDIKNIDSKQLEMIHKIGTEFIELYIFLKEIRYKCENERNEKRKNSND